MPCLLSDQEEPLTLGTTLLALEQTTHRKFSLTSPLPSIQMTPCSRVPSPIHIPDHLLEESTSDLKPKRRKDKQKEKNKKKKRKSRSVTQSTPLNQEEHTRIRCSSSLCQNGYVLSSSGISSSIKTGSPSHAVPKSATPILSNNSACDISCNRSPSVLAGSSLLVKRASPVSRSAYPISKSATPNRCAITSNKGIKSDSLRLPCLPPWSISRASTPETVSQQIIATEAQQQQQQTQQPQQHHPQQQHIQQRRPRRPSLLLSIKPENQEHEKERFMKSNFRYNPQLFYRYPATEASLTKFSSPSSELLHVAEKIMKNISKRYGSFDLFISRTAGKKLNRAEIMEAARKYLKKEGLSEEVSVRFSDDIIARACMTRIRGQPTLQIRSSCIRESWMDGLLRHEIGTHYIRSSNNRLQSWNRSKKRRQLELRPLNPTEEGLAALNSIIFRNEPSLFRSAMLYYVAYQASIMSFTELFKDLAKYIKDPDERWDYVMRAKRGQIDTSLPGTFCKDQVYLKGAMQILKNRKSIDFHALLKCGKVDYRDLDLLVDIADLEHTRVPGFMQDLDYYHSRLSHILEWNNLADKDLDAIQ